MDILRRLKEATQKHLRKIASTINHEAVIKDIALETEISPGYFLTLTLANLIALSGLITNSSPVIIGAMLISPLMGPLLSIGFAFNTGAHTIWQKSVKKIVVSVALTVGVAAAATFLSPLKEITSEILSRTRPNLYDLIIAFLAGSAGAAALCTKKNYLTVVPGVAIATAVIPPLSVAGFGIGVMNANLFLGGFLLFFTNFVAIIIATAVVFFVHGFRPKMITETDLTRLKHRMAYLGTILLLISIPLIYTLHASIVEVRLRSGLSAVLKKNFDRERKSRLTAFDYAKKPDGTVAINAVINVIEYLSEDDITKAEQEIDKEVDPKARLSVEQVKVQPGGLKPVVVKTPAPIIAPIRPPQEVLKASRESAVAVIRQSTAKVEKIISPSSIADFVVGFHEKTFTVSILMKIRRDTPVTDEERLWLKRLLSSELDLPIELSVETTPFVPVLVFEPGKTVLSDEMRSLLKSIGEAYKSDPSLRCRIEAFPEQGMPLKKKRALSRARIEAVEKIITTECAVPGANIESTVSTRSRRMPAVKVTVITHP